MRSTQRFSVMLSNEMAALVRATASGEHASERDVIRDELHPLDAFERAVEDWLRQQALPSYDTYRADPAKGIPLEEVRTTIGERTAGSDQNSEDVLSHCLQT